MLPDLDGYEVCRALKASGSTSQVPIVIVTARIAAENRIQSFHAGADDYVPKPYTPDQIFDALDQSNVCRQDSVPSRIQGDAVLDRRDDGETLRILARLRALLLARSGLEPKAIDRITAAISAIWGNVDAWSRRSSVDRVATLAYALSPESLVLTVHDEAGWLASVGDLSEGPVSTLLIDAGFDEMEADHEAHCLRLAKRFGTLDSCSSWPEGITRLMGSCLGDERPADRASCMVSLTDSNRALLLAAVAWGEQGGHREHASGSGHNAPIWSPACAIGSIPPGYRRCAATADGHSLAGSSDRGGAIEELRRMHGAMAHVDLARVHSTWLVRALEEETPAVQRAVVGSLGDALRSRLQSGLLLDSQDLVSERTAATEVASWVTALWTERLVGGDAERADDSPALVVLVRLAPPPDIAFAA